MTQRYVRETLFEVTVFLLVFSLPFGGYHTQLGTVSVSVTNILLLICLFLLIPILYIRQELDLELAQLVVLIGTGLFLFLYLTAILVQNGSFQWLRTRFGRWLVLLIIIVYVDSSQAIKRILWASFLAAVAVGILTLLSSVFHIPIGTRFYEYREVAGFRIPFVRTLGVKGLTFGVFGIYLLAATPYFAIQAVIDRRKTHLTVMIAIILFTTFVIQSRAVWVATLFVVALLFAIYLFRWHERFPPVLSTLGWVAIILGTLLSPVLVHILIQVRPATFYTRIEQYYNAITVLYTQPLFGLGPGNVRLYPGLHLLPHNAFLRIGVEAGVFAFLLFVAIYGFAAVQSLRGMFYVDTPSKMALPAGLFSALTAAAIISSLQPSFGKATWLILGLAASYNRALE